MSELKMYSLPEVADILGVTHRTAWQYVKDGRIKARKVGRDWKINERYLKEFMGEVDNTTAEDDEI